MRNRWFPVWALAAIGLVLSGRPAMAQQTDLSAAKVLRSIELGKAFLTRRQNDDGSWSMSIGRFRNRRDEFGPVGVAQFGDDAGR